MSDWQDHYLVLGVDRHATQEEIKEAYKFKAFTQHPDRLANAPESVRKRAEEELKKINVAYEFLRDPQKRDQFNSEWDNRRTNNTGTNTGGYSSVIGPKPVVDPENICFEDAEAGELKKASFIIRNIGGPYDKLWFSNPDSWIRVANWASITDIDQLPLRVEIEAKGNEWNKCYREDIKVKLDEQETKVGIELKTKKNPIERQFVHNQQNTGISNAKKSTIKGSASYLVAIIVIVILLFYAYNPISAILFGPQVKSSHLATNGDSYINNKISHADGKTAYTRDGINFVTKERMEENIKYEYAKPGDYRQVQVPKDQIVVGASVIPGET